MVHGGYVTVAGLSSHSFEFPSCQPPTVVGEAEEENEPLNSNHPFG